MVKKKAATAKLTLNPKILADPILPRDRSQERYILKLYICGMTLRSRLAVENIQRICKNNLPDRCDLEIIDIFKHPVQAKEANIVAAPTLIKKYPLPVHRLIGDMSMTEKVLSALDIVISNN